MAVLGTACRRRLFVNGASILGGEAFARLATSLMALVIARSYGSVALGEYGYALALASVLLIVPDFGLHLFTVRELSPAPGRLPEVFWGVHWLKLGLTGIMIVFAVAIGQHSMPDGDGRVLLYLLIGRVVLQTFSQASMAVFKAFERMQYIAFQQIVNSSVVVLWTGAALALRMGLSVVVAGLIAGQLVETLLGWRIIRKQFSPGRLLNWNTQLVFRIAAGCLPIGVTAILLALNLRIDILVLRIYVPTHELGEFQAAAWFATAAFLSSSLVMAVLFPRLSRLLLEPSKEGSIYVGSLLKNGLLITALGSLAAWISAPILVPLLFGPEFVPAAKTLRILAPALPLVFLNTALFYVFVAAGRRFVYMGTLGLAVGMGTALCFLLAPRYGAAGCAIADVARELTISGIYLYFLARGNHARIAGLALLKVFLGAAALLVFGVFFTSELWMAAWMVFVLTGTLLMLGFPRLTEWRLLTDDWP